MSRLMDSKQQNVFDQKLKRVISEGFGTVTVQIENHIVTLISDRSTKKVGSGKVTDLKDKMRVTGREPGNRD